MSAERARRVAAAGVFLCALAGRSVAQEPSAPPPRVERGLLEPGASVPGTVRGAEVHVFRLPVDAGQAVRLALEQQGLDLVLAVGGGQRVREELHDPDIVDRPERWTLLVEHAAELTVEVRAATPRDGESGYALRLEERREATPADQQRLAAERAYLLSQQLRRRGQASDHEAALRGYLEALRTFEALGDLTMQGRCLFGAQSISDAQGRSAEGLQYAQRLHALRRQEGDRRGEARSLLAVGNAHERLRQMEQALQSYQEALPLLAAIDDQLGLGYAHYNIGGVYSDTGEPELALDHLRRSLAIFQRLQHPWEASVLLTIGVVYERTGQHQEALRINGQALELARRSGDTAGEAVLLNNVGELERLLGDPERARAYFTQAHDLMKTAGYPQLQAIVISNLGRAWHELGDHRRALRHLRQSLAMSRAAADPGGEGISLQKIGEVREAQGRLPEALDAYRQSVERFRRAGDRMREADALRDAGDVLQLLGRPREALGAYEEALPAHRRVADRKGESATLHSLARTRLVLGQLEEAQAASQQALTIVESMRAGVLDPDRRTSFLASKRDYYDLHVDVLMRRHRRHPAAGHAAAALEASERARGRGLLEMLAEAHIDAGEGVDPALVERERALRRQVDAKADRLQRLLAAATEPPAAAAARGDLERLLQEHQDARERVRAASPRYAALTQPEPLTLSAIQREVLDGDTLLLEYALGRERSYVWAVTSRSMASAQLPGRARIEAAARRLHALLGTAHRRESAVQARLEAAALSRMVLGPVAKELRGRRLLVVAEGALQYVPFAALPEPEPGPAGAPGEPLIVRHEVVQAPSASALALLRRELAGRPPAPRAVAVLADPVLERTDPRVSGAPAEHSPSGAGEAVQAPRDLLRSADETSLRLRRLRFTRAEADAIVALAGEAPALRAVDFEASRATALRPDLGQYRIVHFATHGLLNNRHPQLSGLVLSLVGSDGQAQDGFLRLHDVFNLKLGADLVVLSACRTALGRDVRGEGLVGLTRGFWYAGAPRVVASLWDVRDQATAELMRRFYRRLLRDGVRPAAALRAAQLSMVKDERWSSPYYWAAFVLQGEWR